MSFELCCIGDLNIDIVTSKIKQMPEKEKQTLCSSFMFNLGGSSAITCAGAANLGVKTALQSCLGQDYFGELLIKKLKKNKVRCFIEQPERIRTGCTFAMNFSDGSKSFVSWFENNWAFRKKMINFDVIKNSRHLHVSGLWHLKSLADSIPEIMRFAHSSCRTTSLDIGTALKGDRKKAFEIFKNVDILFLNKHEMRNLRTNVRELLDYADIVCVHAGEKGAFTYTKDEKYRTKSLGFKCLNPVGTGDVFNSGFLYGFLRNKTVKKCAEAGILASTFYMTHAEQVFPKPGNLHYKKLL